MQAARSICLRLLASNMAHILSSTQCAGSNSPWMLMPPRLVRNTSMRVLRSAMGMRLGASSVRSTACRSVAVKYVWASKATLFKMAVSFKVGGLPAAAWTRVSIAVSAIGCPGCPMANASCASVLTPCVFSDVTKGRLTPVSCNCDSNCAELSIKELMASQVDLKQKKSQHVWEFLDLSKQWMATPDKVAMQNDW